jgi:two-component system response regulator (stage 0 sporulation protein F)
MTLKILVVDDEKDMRRILRGILEPLSTICEAADGNEALSVLSRERPDLMLLDVAMPGLDGIAVLKRALEAQPNLAVVMLTGAVDFKVVRDALEGGARSYITKPFEIEAVTAEVRRLAGQDAPLHAPDDPPWTVKGKGEFRSP